MAPSTNSFESAAEGGDMPPWAGASGTAAETDRVVLSFPPRPEHVSLARMLAAAIATRAGLDNEAVEDIRLLVSEACTNAVRAHAARSVDAPIQVVCRTDGSFHLEVYDLGGGFDVAGRHAFPNAATGEGEAGGWGIPLMQVLSENSTFVTNTEGGTTVRLSVPSDMRIVIDASPAAGG